MAVKRPVKNKAEDGKGSNVLPPSPFVAIYFGQKGSTLSEAKTFLEHYSRNGWTTHAYLVIDAITIGLEESLESIQYMSGSTGATP